MSNVIRLPKLIREAEVRAQSFDESANTIDVVFTTGATGRRVSWLEGEFDEELVVTKKSVRLDRLNNGAPFLDTHSKWSLSDVLGSVVRGSARIEGSNGVAKVLLSKAADVADRVAKIKEGVVSNISVGYRIHAVEKKERVGQTPLHRVIDWEPWEISAVPIPFDAGAQIRAAADENETFACRVVGDDASSSELVRIRMRMAAAQYGLAR
ncbi:HK97 family phage prohead protease [Shinella zoogloeoides]|uniref:HK97 family phage prohead protease n=1 Tax=Shinella zoogloeoides TaxID=352475 RepID=UPI0028B0380F|nr:HK97 family phage prohead protease [Shinella zoogloeoides]